MLGGVFVAPGVFVLDRISYYSISFITMKIAFGGLGSACGNNLWAAAIRAAQLFVLSLCAH